VAPLCARLDQDQYLAFMSAVRIGKGTHLDLVSRHSGLRQRIADGNRPAVAEFAIASTGSPIQGAIYADFQRWILHEVSRNLGNSVHLGTSKARIAAIEAEIPIGRPSRDNTGDALIARQSLPTRISGKTLFAGRTAWASGPGGSRIAGPLQTRKTALTFFPGRACCAGHSASANDNGAWRTRRARETGGADKIRTIVSDPVFMRGGAGRGKHRDARKKQHPSHFHYLCGS
jgi:hypothetical protein